jgi:energy-coupling factor transporter ATP-binding protein EcfA2
MLYSLKYSLDLKEPNLSKIKMSEYFIDPSLLTNESDVEQKIVYKLLTNEEPTGLGYSSFNIYTKLNLRKLDIDKGGNSKLYYPDYVAIIDGFPLVVIEVKRPNEDLVEAFREARLYALEINSLYSTELNPCKLILATDGIKLLAGNWDDNTPNYVIDIKHWISSNNEFGNFIDEFCFQKQNKIALSLKETLRTNVVYKRPLNLLGGKHIQNAERKNSFGETISISYRHLFNPNDEIERADIVKNAYVKVDKHLSHVHPIDRLIRKKISPSIAHATEISNNLKPVEILSKLNNAHNYNNQLLLLIGSVGSGKSTFISYLKEVGISKSVVAKLTWIRVDLNSAPVNKDEIYIWLKNAIIDTIIEDNSDVDVNALDVFKDIYSLELMNFDKIALMLGKDSDVYKLKLFEEINKLKENLDLKVKNFIDFFIHKKGKEFIIVLDNCDKRNLEEQLLMFEVANWLKDSFKCIVFLPLRETTFDHFRNEKPLDTVIKDLTFRINPPSLEKVIYTRIKYAGRLGSKGDKGNYYQLPNGFTAYYPSSDELNYLKSILKSLFQNSFFKRLISGLAGRDVRKGIEIFLDFCKSGHISETEIMKMKFNQGDYSLQNHIVSRVFLRGSREYYSDSETRIKNLFHCEPSDKFPDPFLRVAILDWLNERRRIKGTSGIVGFYKVEELLIGLSVLGHNTDNILSELKVMAKNSMIITESQNDDVVELEELISINSPGYIHLELLSNIDYLSSCSEDVWYSKATVATRIASRINNSDAYPHFSLYTTTENSKDLIDYLEEYSSNFNVTKQFLAEDQFKPPLDFSLMRSKLKNFGEQAQIEVTYELVKNSIVNAQIVKILESGLICNIVGSEYQGMLHISNIDNKNFYDDEVYNVGQTFSVEIIGYKQEHSRYNIRFA